MSQRGSESFALESVDSVQDTSGMLLASVSVTLPGSVFKLDKVNKERASTTAEKIRTAVEARRGALSSAQRSQPEVSVADELRKLADLRSEGVLSDAEFAEQKAKLLA